MSPVRSSVEYAGAGPGRPAALFGDLTAATAAGLFGSIALFPLVALQGTLTRRRVPCLPPCSRPTMAWLRAAGP